MNRENYVIDSLWWYNLKEVYLLFKTRKKLQVKRFNVFHLKPIYSEYEHNLYHFESCLQYDKFVTETIQRYDYRAQSFISAIEKKIEGLVNRKLGKESIVMKLPTMKIFYEEYSSWISKTLILIEKNTKPFFCPRKKWCCKLFSCWWYFCRLTKIKMNAYRHKCNIRIWNFLYRRYKSKPRKYRIFRQKYDYSTLQRIQSRPQKIFKLPKTHQVLFKSEENWKRAFWKYPIQEIGMKSCISN